MQIITFQSAHMVFLSILMLSVKSGIVYETKYIELFFDHSST